MTTMTMNVRDGRAMPLRFETIEDLDDFMTSPSPALVADMERIDGDLIVLGVGGKMGPTLARMAKRAAPGKRVIGVARFTDSTISARLQSQGVECIACDLLDQDALRRLPRVPNVVYMAGHKFGARGNPSFTWAMNAALPLLVADHFRASRIVALSTICVYPYSDASGPGASEDVPSQPPTGDYTNSCVGREQVFMHGSDRWGTAGRLVRLSYAIDMRYGVLHDIASAVLAASPLDVTMGYVNLIWQGDANEQILRLLAECTAPTSPINVTGPEKASVREIAEAFGRRFDRVPILTGHEADTAWIADTSQAQRLFGRPGVPLNRMIDWVADWVSRGGASFGKATHFETRDGSY